MRSLVSFVRGKIRDGETVIHVGGHLAVESDRGERTFEFRAKLDLTHIADMIRQSIAEEDIDNEIISLYQRRMRSTIKAAQARYGKK